VTEGLRVTVESAPPPLPDDVLHPDCEPYATGRLAVSTRHAMHWEMCGNPDGP